MATDNTDTTRLREDLDALRGDIGRLAESVRTLTEKGAWAGVDRARRRAGEAREQVEHLAEEVGHHLEERPYGSVMMAFGLGFVIGKLLERR